MGSFRLLNYAGDGGAIRPGILVGGDTVVDLQQALPGAAWTASTIAVLGAWDAALPALHALADTPPKAARPLASVRLLAPLLYPPAIYCTGANYMDHAEEMSPEKKGLLEQIARMRAIEKKMAVDSIASRAEIEFGADTQKREDFIKAQTAAYEQIFILRTPGAPGSWSRRQPCTARRASRGHRWPS